MSPLRFFRRREKPVVEERWRELIREEILLFKELYDIMSPEERMMVTKYLISLAWTAKRDRKAVEDFLSERGVAQ